MRLLVASLGLLGGLALLPLSYSLSHADDLGTDAPTLPLEIPPPPEGATAEPDPSTYEEHPPDLQAELPQIPPDAAAVTGTTDTPEAAAQAPVSSEAAPHLGSSGAPLEGGDSGSASAGPSSGYESAPPDPGLASAATAREGRRPLYQLQRPEVAFEIATSLHALKDATIPELENSKIRGLSFLMEYQPAALQRFGVVGIGGSLNAYPLTEASSLKIQSGSTGGAVLGFWSAGAHLRYQARYFREQILVPTVGYNLEYWSYSLSQAGESGRFLATGPVFGAQLLLNPLEPSAAAENFVAHGISRSYLVAELRTLNGAQGPITLRGQSLFFGLRFEY